MTGDMEAIAGGVRARMYRGLLGDCFLLAFPRKNRAPAYMLIDCGIMRGSHEESKTMRTVVKNIKKATGERIDVVVVTHEHFDHLCGFRYGRETFNGLRLGQAWLPWTEEPDDGPAAALREVRARRLRALTGSVKRLSAADHALGARLQSLLEFSQRVRDDLNYVRESADRVRYLRPAGKPFDIPGVDGIRVYVLGPPEDETLFGRAEPSEADSEVYGLHVALGVDAAFIAAATATVDSPALRKERDRLRDLTLPFDRQHRLTKDRLKERPKAREFFGEYYGLSRRGQGGENEWRRIDDDWLRKAEDIALQLDHDTNNTSLVLAIELVKSKQVLLFPGDAQVGNMLSWPEVEFKLGRRRTLKGKELLERTVLYKVGHHGSHNGTLREEGLELMDSPDLVAMLPVDEETAANKNWDMPFDPLLKRLKQKTGGRVLRADRDRPSGRRLNLSTVDRRKFYKATEGSTDLYHEYIVTD
jgi:glyoxylase-like metal-dependent hydrolase (beta-lactamase superfamily II)